MHAGTLILPLVKDISPEAACHLAQSCAPNDEFPGQLVIPQRIKAGFLEWLNQTGLNESSLSNQCDCCQTLVSEATQLLGNTVSQQPCAHPEDAIFLSVCTHRRMSWAYSTLEIDRHSHCNDFNDRPKSRCRDAFLVSLSPCITIGTRLPPIALTIPLGFQFHQHAF